MNVLFAMGLSTTQDSSGYIRLLPQMWPLFAVPVLCFYAVLGAWVVRKIRGMRQPEEAFDQSDAAVAGGERGIRTPGGV